jgi:glycine/D-amino acid oxidase-like deaminating enzyme
VFDFIVVGAAWREPVSPRRSRPRLTVEAALVKVPRLRPGYLAAALYEPGVCDIDVAALLQGFLRQGKRRGVRLHVGERCGGYGIQSALACAQLAAALARGEAVPAAIAAEGVTAEAVSPARFTSRVPS